MKAITILAATSLPLLATVARADLPPPGDYVEDCTTDKQQRTGEECLLCGNVYHSDRDRCARDHKADGYERRCKTWGGSVWREVWCKKSTDDASPPVAAPVHNTQAPTPEPAQPTTSGTCSVVPRGLASGWLLVLLTLMRPRPRRR